MGELPTRFDHEKVMADLKRAEDARPRVTHKPGEETGGQVPGVVRRRVTIGHSPVIVVRELVVRSQGL